MESSVAVKIPVHVVPPSEEPSVLKVPPTTVTSPFAKPVTASLKVIVTTEVLVVSLKAASVIATVAVGLVVSTVAVSLAPVTPTLLTASAYAPLTVTDAPVVESSVAVNVPVQVTPPSELVKVPSVPPATVTSLFAKPVTASLNVIVTVDVFVVSLSADSVIATVAVGFVVSTVAVSVAPVAPTLLTASA